MCWQETKQKLNCSYRWLREISLLDLLHIFVRTYITLPLITKRNKYIPVILKYMSDFTIGLKEENKKRLNVSKIISLSSCVSQIVRT